MEQSMTAAPEAVSAAAAVDLPPFSFSKKPVMMHSTGHSAISEILPASTGSRNQQRDGAPALQNDAEMAQSAGVAAPFNDIDYDEQIRAPRMNYTYSNARGAFAAAAGRKDSCDSKETVAVTPAATSPTSEAKHDDAKQRYEPATFDLTQSTRRLSAPTEATEAVKTAILDYTTNNYIYERNSGPRKVVRTEPHEAPSIRRQPTEQSADSHKLSKALENLNNNAMSRERQPVSSAGAAATTPGRIKNRTSNLVAPHHLSHRNGTELQQVYELKKPLCMPAVLRPIASSSTPTLSASRPQTPADEAAEGPGSGGGSPSTPHLQIRAYPFPSTAPPLTPTAGAGDSLAAIKVSHVQPSEPTHEHWKPNNYTSHCMRCFDPFGGFFTPQRKRRHHCRFCGLIFCFDCLWQNDNDGTGMTAAEASAGTAAGGNIALNRLSRSDSTGSIVGSGNGGSLGGSLGGKLFTSASNPLLSGLTNAESVGGVLLDSEANFVVPINSVIQKTGLSSRLGEYFKSCKVCKECGNNYQGLLAEWNAAGSHPDKTAPFVFVENPFLHQSSSQNESRQKLIERGRQMSGIQEADLPEDAKTNFDVLPNAKVANVPSDWSWSSF
ncbi:FYVE-type domain-containing protein [[Candida] zeylanoides]